MTYTAVVRDRTAWAVTATVALVVLWVLSPVFAPDQILFQRDHLTLFRRHLHEVIDAYAMGRLPLWTPWSGGGEPLAAYPSAMATSPLLLVFALPGDFHQLYDLFVVIHIPLAAVSAWVLAREEGAAAVPALGAAVAFALGGTFLSLNSLLPALESAAFGPLALALGLKLARRPTLRALAAFAAVLGLHVQVADPAFLFADLVLFVVAWRPPVPRSTTDGLVLARATAWLMAGAVLALCLTAAQVLPLLDLLRDAPRGHGFDYARVAANPLHPYSLLELFLPGLNGDPSTSGNTLAFYMGSAYLGATAVPLMILGAAIRPRFLATALFFTTMALGELTPVHRWMVELIPGLQNSRFAIKYSYGLAISASLLVAWGLTHMQREATWSPRVRSAMLAALATCGAAVVWLSTRDLEWVERVYEGMHPEQSLDAAHMGGTLGVLWLSLAIGLAFTVARGRLSPHVGAAAMVLLLSSDLALQARRRLVTTSAQILELSALGREIARENPEPSLFVYDPFALPTPCTTEGQRECVPLDDWPRDDVRAAYMSPRLPPGVSGLHRQRHVLDLSLNATRGERWTQTVLAFERSTEPERYRLLASLGVTHVVATGMVRSAPPGGTFCCTLSLLGGPPVSAIRLPAARAVVSVAHDVEVVDDLQAATESLRTSSVAADRVRIERAFLNTLTFEPGTPRPRAQLVRAEQARPENISAWVDAPGPGTLVVMQSFAEGWSATIDGSPAPIIPAEAMMMGVPFPPGARHIVLEYSPRALDVALATTSLTMIVLLAMAAVRPRGQGT